MPGLPGQWRSPRYRRAQVPRTRRDIKPANVVVSTRLDAVSLESAWTVERAERWWPMHRPLPADARRVAEVLLSQEGREFRIGPRVRPMG
jgi:hypothetical protein